MTGRFAWLMVSGKNHDTVTVGTTGATGAHWREIGSFNDTLPGIRSEGAACGYLAGWLPDSKSFLVCLSAPLPKRGRDEFLRFQIRKRSSKVGFSAHSGFETVLLRPPTKCHNAIEA